jgi:hypothetical protein
VLAHAGSFGSRSECQIDYLIRARLLTRVKNRTSLTCPVAKEFYYSGARAQVPPTCSKVCTRDVVNGNDNLTTVACLAAAAVLVRGGFYVCPERRQRSGQVSLTATPHDLPSRIVFRKRLGTQRNGLADAYAALSRCARTKLPAAVLLLHTSATRSEV